VIGRRDCSAGELRRFPSWLMRIGFFRRRPGQRADGSAWREVLKTCSKEPASRISVFTISATHSPPGLQWTAAIFTSSLKSSGHSNIKMTERYAKLGRQHIARTGSTAREIWKQLEGICDNARRMTMSAYCSRD
jgi:hypothetical protein